MINCHREIILVKYNDDKCSFFKLRENIKITNTFNDVRCENCAYAKK